MNLGISFFIALRYWRAKSADRFGRLVTNLASAGIVLGVTALIIVLSVMNGLENQQKQQVLSGIPHAVIMPKEGSLFLSDYTKRLPNLAASPWIEKIEPINNTNVIMQTAAGVSAGRVIGVSKPSDDMLLNYLAPSDFEQFLPQGEFQMIIGSRLAEQLRLNVGEKVRLMMTENSQYTPFGRMPMQRLFTVSHIYPAYNEVSGYEVFTHLSDIGRLMRISPEQVQGVRLWLNDPFLITALPQIFAETEWKIDDWRSQKGEFFQAVRMEKNMMGLLISLIIMVAVSNIVTSLSLMVVDKQGEIAILQTQGLTKKQIRRIFIFQGFLVGLVGTLIGLLLGVLLTLNLDGIIYLINPQGILLPTLIEWQQIAFILLFSLALALLSTIYPAYRASKVEPAEALRYE